MEQTDMENVTDTVHMPLGHGLTFSIFQQSKSHQVEVAMLATETDASGQTIQRFIRPINWCLDWVGEDYDDDVIAGCDAHDVLDLLQLAKQYVYIKENR